MSKRSFYTVIAVMCLFFIAFVAFADEQEECTIALCWNEAMGAYGQGSLAPADCPNRISKALERMLKGEDPHDCPHANNRVVFKRFRLVRVGGPPGTEVEFCDSGSGDTRSCIKLGPGWYNPEPYAGIRLGRGADFVAVENPSYPGQWMVRFRAGGEWKQVPASMFTEMRAILPIPEGDLIANTLSTPPVTLPEGFSEDALTVIPDETRYGRDACADGSCTVVEAWDVVPDEEGEPSCDGIVCETDEDRR